MSGVLETADPVCAQGRLAAALERIRPDWRAHPSLPRIRALLPVAPARALQLLLELAEADLRDKVSHAGLAVAEAAARLARLPAIGTAEDLGGYAGDDLLDLGYAMCLLDAEERLRLGRAGRAASFDDEAFLACIELVLAREPVSPLRDITPEMILEALPGSAWTRELVLNFASAPDQAQIQIEQFLMQLIGDESRSAPIRSAALAGLRLLNAAARRSAQMQVGELLKTQLRRRLGTLPDMRISAALGIVPYLTESRIRRFFAHYLRDAQQQRGEWLHDEALLSFLDEFRTLGGLAAVEPALRRKLVLWLVRGYVGAAGRDGEAEPPLFGRIETLLRDASALVAEDFAAAAASDIVTATTQEPEAARRLDRLRRLVQDGT